MDERTREMLMTVARSLSMLAEALKKFVKESEQNSGPVEQAPTVAVK